MNLLTLGYVNGRQMIFERDRKIIYLLILTLHYKLFINGFVIFNFWLIKYNFMNVEEKMSL